MVMNSSIFWDMTPCSPLKFNRRFRRTYHLHLQGQRISRTKNQSQSRWQAYLLSLWSLVLLILRPWRWRRHVPLKRRLTFNGLHDVISQKIELSNKYRVVVSFYYVRYHRIWKTCQGGAPALKKAQGCRPVSTTPLVIARKRFGTTVFLCYSIRFITVFGWSYFLSYVTFLQFSTDLKQIVCRLRVRLT
jgi:hypothetical protein